MLSTTTPAFGLVTTTLPPPVTGCIYEKEYYADGALIPSKDPCEHCYCMKNEIVCAVQECRSPLDEVEENCIPKPPPPGQCCPIAYDCRKFKAFEIFSLKNCAFFN